MYDRLVSKPARENESTFWPSLASLMKPHSQRTTTTPSQISIESLQLLHSQLLAIWVSPCWSLSGPSLLIYTVELPSTQLHLDSLPSDLSSRRAQKDLDSSPWERSWEFGVSLLWILWTPLSSQILPRLDRGVSESTSSSFHIWFCQ